MEKWSTPAIALAALTLLIATMIYVGGYFALSYQHSETGERIFGAKWQYQLYEPLVKVESWAKGGSITIGYRPAP